MNFEELVNEKFKSMLEAAFEYSDFNEEEIKLIYVFCSLEEGFYYDFFYRIGGEIVKKHLINDFLISKCNDSDEQQLAAVDIGLNDLIELEKLFIENEKDLPTQIKIKYVVKDQSIDTDMVYSQNLIGTNKDDLELRNEWIESLQKSINIA